MAPPRAPNPEASNDHNPPAECFNTENISVVVGPEKRKFGIQRGLLCHYSDYFATNLNGLWPESSTREVHLDQDEVETFKLFNTWLYTRKVHLELDGADKDREWYRLSRLYVFADMRFVPQLKDTVVTMIVAKYGHLQSISVDHIAYVYHNTPSSSLLRKLMTDMFACKAKLDQLSQTKTEETLGVQCGDFLWDLVRSLQEMRPKRTPSPASARFHRDVCKYHEHGEAKVCAAGNLV